jgi:hypothetical protein
MALSKIQSESVNLADNFAFTGTVTGAGGLVKLATTTVSTAVSEIEFNNTLVNSTYDNYYLTYTVTPSSDNVTFRMRFLDTSNSQINNDLGYSGGSINEGATASTNTNGASQMEISGSMGSASGESASGQLWFGPVNEGANFPCQLNGFHNGINQSGNHQGRVFFFCLSKGYFQSVGGIKINFTSGNVEAGTFTLYGVAK